MGQSTDAILFYGILFEDEDEAPEFMREAGYDDWWEFLEAESGLPLYGEAGHSFEAHQEYREKQPVDLIQHCSGDYPMYGLCVRGSEVTARRGYPISLEDGLPEISNDQEQAFFHWCEKHNIKLQDPKWILCSNWN